MIYEMGGVAENIAGKGYFSSSTQNTYTNTIHYFEIRTQNKKKRPLLGKN
jgi:hypothetical protein